MSDELGADLVLIGMNSASLAAGVPLVLRTIRGRIVQSAGLAWLVVAFVVPIAIVVSTWIVGETQDGESQWRAAMAVLWAFLTVITAAAGFVTWLLLRAGE